MWATDVPDCVARKTFSVEKYVTLQSEVIHGVEIRIAADVVCLHGEIRSVGVSDGVKRNVEARFKSGSTWHHCESEDSVLALL